jgi:hypothetical protein
MRDLTLFFDPFKEQGELCSAASSSDLPRSSKYQFVLLFRQRQSFGEIDLMGNRFHRLSIREVYNNQAGARRMLMRLP